MWDRGSPPFFRCRRAAERAPSDRAQAPGDAPEFDGATPWRRQAFTTPPRRGRLYSRRDIT
jgi:hypothetical protein